MATTVLAAQAQMDANLAAARPRLALRYSKLQETFISPNVNCHQGYAWDGTNHYTFDTQGIYKRQDDLYWTVTASNTATLKGLAGLNHMGDGDYYNGQLYVACEKWGGCGNYTNQCILTFDANTLLCTGRYDVSAEGHEMSGLVVVPDDGPNGAIYVTSYCDGSQLWKYDLASMTFLGTLPLQTNLPNLQGVAYNAGTFYAAGDLGSIWSFDTNGAPKLVYVSSQTGSHEGLAFVNGGLRQLIDRGGTDRCVHYISLPSFDLTFTSTGSGWVVESAPSLAGPWSPAICRFAATNVTDSDAALPMPPAKGSLFYRMRRAVAPPDAAVGNP
ncbi:MAG TPA: hypothetical protein VHB20_01515 [Verrucomicrobiae bacterium]|nr:hypothetical protein [Verrucomicrobiae bacterium]